MGRFVYRDDIAIADRAVELWGESPDDLFATAARSLAELMADPDSLGEGVRREVMLQAESLELLLFEFLSELIFLKDRDRAIFPRAEVRVTAPGGPGVAVCTWTLSATLHGDVVDPARTRRGLDVKAVTLHELRVERQELGWHGHFVLDL
jgi:SHS2 domain-containing protein